MRPFFKGKPGSRLVRSEAMVSNLVVYGLSHALVDAACAAAVYSVFKSDQLGVQAFFYLVVLYDTLAFALQSQFGLLLDRLQMPKLFAITGCLLIAVSLLLLWKPYVAIVMAGVGNALFHVGGGVVSLNLAPGTAASPGLFVAPGALGLWFGALIGKDGLFAVWLLALLLLAAVGLIAMIRSPEMSRDNARPDGQYKYAAPVILLLLLSIGIRSLVGLAPDYSWKTDASLLLLLTLAVFLGKACGGILGDRLGWLRTAVLGLVLSAPLLAFGSSYPYLVIPGIFLFNLTMPVTLAAIANMLPGRAGFAFGLTTLALIIGAYPVFTVYRQQLSGPWATLAFIIIAVVALFTGLRLYLGALPVRHGARAWELPAGGS